MLPEDPPSCVFLCCVFGSRHEYCKTVRLLSVVVLKQRTHRVCCEAEHTFCTFPTVVSGECVASSDQGSRDHFQQQGAVLPGLSPRHSPGKHRNIRSAVDCCLRCDSCRFCKQHTTCCQSPPELRVLRELFFSGVLFSDYSGAL